MLIKVYNLILASLTMILACLFMMASKNIFSSMDIETVLFMFSAPIWFCGALGLFWEKSWAWYASVVGIAFMFVENAKELTMGLAIAPYATDPTDGAGYMLIYGFGGVAFSLPLLIVFFLKHTHLVKMNQHLSPMVGQVNP
ncbi:MAG: hypothetical protein NTY53_18700 [Kiritimatiellaeota bacterium]|nr:hypothetical protein [Kiritimatiellota bacterium]